MILCDICKRPCCDFCIHCIHEIEIMGDMRMNLNPIGCSLHKDKEHQEKAEGCGYCEDFHCKHAEES